MSALQAVKIINIGEPAEPSPIKAPPKVGPLNTRGVQGGVSEAKVDQLLVERVQKVTSVPLTC